jgi:Kdo2-lipid IVA lauroyltransferase/acyltransferase
VDRDDEEGRDLRTGGAWSRRQRAKNDLIFGLSVLALAASRALPLRALRALGRGLGAAAHALAGGARRTALANVRLVFPEMDQAARRAFVRRSFVTMGELLADAVALLRPRGGPLLVLAPGAREIIDEARREGRGVVFASAHLGPWERVAASLVAAGVPLTTLARESYDPRFTRLYQRLRGARGVRVVWRSPAPGAAGARGAGALATTAGIVRTLRGGGVLGVPMDLRSRVPSCEAPFLGHPADTAVGPARIALRTGAAVVVGTVAPAGATLVITATRIPTSGLDSHGNEGARDLTMRINRELSCRILALPHAWVWMHERWTASAGYDVNFE